MKIDYIKKHLPAIFAWVLIVWAAFWLVFNAYSMSVTSDEIVYIPSGARSLMRGDEILNSEHPPLNKILSALFVLPLNPDIDTAIEEVSDSEQWEFGNVFLFESGNPTDLVMFLGRLSTVLLTLFLLVSLWLWMAKNVHPWAGVGAVASLSLNPNILAHGALTTNDMHLTVAVWILFLATYNLIKTPKLSKYIWWGLALGLVMLAKFSGVFFVVISILIVIGALIYKKENFWLSFGRLVSSIVVCLALVWMAYVVIEYRALLGSRTINLNVPTVGTVQLDNPITKTIVAPLLRYKEGYNVVQGHNEIGHNAYLDGAYSMSGFREFFVMAIWYKTPTALLLLALVGFVWAVVKRQWVVLSMATIGIIFVGAASFGHIHIGIRHILPFYIFIAPAVGFAVWKLVEVRRIIAYGFLILIATWWIGDLALNSPNKISYFSQISGGWSTGYKHMSDSNTDWGQEMNLLATYSKNHPDKKLIIGYACGEDPAYRGVDYVNVTDLGRYTACEGIADDEVLIISVNVATGLFGPYPCISDKIDRADRLGHTFLIFEPDDFKNNK